MIFNIKLIENSKYILHENIITYQQRVQNITQQHKRKFLVNGGFTRVKVSDNICLNIVQTFFDEFTNILSFGFCNKFFTWTDKKNADYSNCLYELNKYINAVPLPEITLEELQNSYTPAQLWKTML